MQSEQNIASNTSTLASQKASEPHARVDEHEDAMDVSMEVDTGNSSIEEQYEPDEIATAVMLEEPAAEDDDDEDDEEFIPKNVESDDDDEDDQLEDDSEAEADDNLDELIEDAKKLDLSQEKTGMHSLLPGQTPQYYGQGLKFNDSYEEEEAQMTDEEADSGDEEDELEDRYKPEEVATAVMLKQPTEAADDESDGDFIPQA